MTSKLALSSTKKLNSGYQIPLLGYGVYQVPKDQASDVCKKALEIGYRHVRILRSNLNAVLIDTLRSTLHQDITTKALAQQESKQLAFHAQKSSSPPRSSPDNFL
jgi:hypothetical protein